MPSFLEIFPGIFICITFLKPFANSGKGFSDFVNHLKLLYRLILSQVCFKAVIGKTGLFGERNILQIEKMYKQ